MLLMVNGALLLLRSEERRVGKEVGTWWLPNAREMGERVTAEVVPVPLRLTVCGLPAALLLPVEDGIRATAVTGVQACALPLFPLTARVEGLRGQLLVWLKSPVLAPVSEMLLMVNGALLLL